MGVSGDNLLMAHMRPLGEGKRAPNEASRWMESGQSLLPVIRDATFQGAPSNMPTFAVGRLVDPEFSPTPERGDRPGYGWGAEPLGIVGRDRIWWLWRTGLADGTTRHIVVDSQSLRPPSPPSPGL
jgi:hypothetical protein